MSIRPVDFNGMIQNTHDVGAMKQQEDQRPVVNQQNIGTQMERTEQQQLQRVNGKQEAQRDEGKYDAKEKGNNTYNGTPQKRKKKEQQKDKVEVKANTRSFDVKI